MGGMVTAVSCSAVHALDKPNQGRIRLLTGLGVAGDAHAGETVQHRSRVARDPAQPNLRQVHLIHAELHDALLAAGFGVSAGQMGENITTRGIDLLALPTGTRLHIGDTAMIAVTGLRNPCAQLDAWQPGLMAATLGRDPAGNVCVGDFSNNRVRMVAAVAGSHFGQAMTAGRIYTVAGNGTAAAAGDAGMGPAASLNAPAGVAFDPAGNLYVADRSNHRIRMVTRQGVIYTVAGSGQSGWAGDGGPATAGKLNFPIGVTVTPEGRIVLAMPNALRSIF